MTMAFSFSEDCSKPVSIGGLLSLALFLLTIGGFAAAFALKGRLWQSSNLGEYQMRRSLKESKKNEAINQETRKDLIPLIH